jgi:hypothetical protein
MLTSLKLPDCTKSDKAEKERQDRNPPFYQEWCPNKQLLNSSPDKVIQDNKVNSSYTSFQSLVSKQRSYHTDKY